MVVKAVEEDYFGEEALYEVGPVQAVDAVGPDDPLLGFKEFVVIVSGVFGQFEVAELREVMSKEFSQVVEAGLLVSAILGVVVEPEQSRVYRIEVAEVLLQQLSQSSLGSSFVHQIQNHHPFLDLLALLHVTGQLPSDLRLLRTNRKRGSQTKVWSLLPQQRQRTSGLNYRINGLLLAPLDLQQALSLVVVGRLPLLVEAPPEPPPPHRRIVAPRYQSQFVSRVFLPDGLGGCKAEDELSEQFIGEVLVPQRMAEVAEEGMLIIGRIFVTELQSLGQVIGRVVQVQNAKGLLKRI